MSDNTQGGGAAAPTAGPAPSSEKGSAFRVLTQYVKDLSFENPNAPQALGNGLPQPAIDILVDVLPKQLGKDQYEVCLKLTARATRGDKVVFLVDLLYAGAFHIAGVPEESLQPLVLIEAPRFLFPFARRIVSDLTRDGGFPPLALDYMDFAQIYRQQLAKAKEDQAAAADTEASGDDA